MTNRLHVFVFALFACSAASAQAPVAAGGEFQVNSYTTNRQYKPRTALLPDGRFLVVWTSGSSSLPGLDGDRKGISARRYSSQGVALGGELLVNTYTTDHQDDPMLAVAADGDFVVVWGTYRSNLGDSSSSSVVGQRFASDGARLGGEFQVNVYTTDRQRNPAVGMAADGAFVVAWEDLGFSFPFDGQDGSRSGVRARRFASNGTAIGGEFQVNTYTTYTQYNIAVAVEEDGDFVVVWEHRDDYLFESDIRAQRYASDGSPRGGELQVNSYTTGTQKHPGVGMSPSGDFVVSWAGVGPGPANPNSAIHARRYLSTGAPLGSELQVNTHNSVAINEAPAVAVADDGFAVVWGSFRSTGGDTDNSSIQLQRFEADGMPLGGELLVNSYTTFSQYRPAVSATSVSRFLVVWDGYDATNAADPDGSVQAQRFDPHIFSDGFESGNTSAWSAMVP